LAEGNAFPDREAGALRVVLRREVKRVLASVEDLLSGFRAVDLLWGDHIRVEEVDQLPQRCQLGGCPTANGEVSMFQVAIFSVSAAAPPASIMPASENAAILILISPLWPKNAPKRCLQRKSRYPHAFMPWSSRSCSWRC